MKDIVILAIETSCDETAIAIVKNGQEILANVISSQIETHKLFGGVVPEVASRIHVENITLVLEEAITQANIKMDDIDAIAFTQGPGLIGCLHIGVVAAKTLAWLYQKPLIAVQHIMGHIVANCFVSKLKYPLLALVVSGGHTELVLMSDAKNYELLGCTQDDAVGEAFDKIARLIGLPYPGGVHIDKHAQSGQATYTLPMPKTENKYDFSFSGLKSAVLQLIEREKKQGREINVANLAASFQNVAIEQLLNKSRLAITEYKPKHFVLAGGVAANSLLRAKISQELENFPEVELTIPPLFCCTDNGAMIAAAAYNLYLSNEFVDLSVGANPSLEL